MASFSFGSFGDIVALCQIAAEVRQALSDARGSSKDYQELQHDLLTFVNVLGQVIATYTQYEASPYMQSLASAVKQVVDDCTSLLETARNTWIRKYNEYLGPGDVGNGVKGVYKKLRWRMEKDDVAQLRQRLGMYITRLTLLSSLTNSRSARVDQETLLQRIKQVESAVAGRDAYLLEIVEAQKIKIEAIQSSIERQNQSVATIFGVLRSMAQAARGVQKALEENIQYVAEIHHILTNSRFFQALDPTRGQDIIWEDALGEIYYFSSNTFKDWDIFYLFVASQFKGHKGLGKVQRREYTLEESLSGREIDTTMPIHFALRPGMKVDMSMIFSDIKLDGVCPKCKTRTQATEGTTVKCQTPNCGMSLRLSEKIILRARRAAAQSVTTSTETHLTEAIDDMASQEASCSGDGHNRGRLTPTDFKRVHLIEEKIKYSTMNYGQFFFRNPLSYLDPRRPGALKTQQSMPPMRSATSRAKDQYGKPQVFHAGSRIDQSKWIDLLNRKFGDNYHVHMSHNKYKVYAIRPLTEKEINSCF